MKKILLTVFGFLTLSAQVAMGQTFTISDTVRFVYVQGGSTPTQVANDFISTPSTHDSVAINWKVVATDFPSDWSGSNLGICDNNNCYTNGTQALWNSSTQTGTLWPSKKYAGLDGDFHMQIDLSSASTGVHYMKVLLTDASNSSSTKTTTFIVSKYNVGVPSINHTDDNVSLYPNPANDEVNLVYGADANVKTIAVYNLIGRVMTVYKPMNNNSARLNIENIPAGIYFVRLMDGQGNVVATRKFTRQ